MAETQYEIYQIQFQDLVTGETIVGSGGVAYVAAADSPSKVAIYNATTYASADNPISLSNGKLSFATLASVASVDIYVMAPGGQFCVRRGVTPGTTEIFIDRFATHQTAVIPWDATAITAAAETDTGFKLPRWAQVIPWVAIEVKATDSTETIDVGLLSSESGGDADGFIVAASVATAGTIVASAAGTDTLGALLQQTTESGSSAPIAYAIGATAKSVVVTTSAGSDTGKGFVIIPYIRSVTV